MSIEAMTKKVNANMWKSCKKIVLEECIREWFAAEYHELAIDFFLHFLSMENGKVQL